MSILYVLDQLKGLHLSRRYKVLRGLYYYWYRMLSWMENVYITNKKIPKNPLNNSSRKETITASLTSYPGRINEVYYAIKSIMLQTMKPDRIVLWLSEEQFPEKSCPPKICELERLGLEVRFIQNDYKSHKKYFVALQEQRINELVITFDDDIIYDPRCIERAYTKHLQYPNAIVANQVLCITTKDNAVLSYSTWIPPEPEQEPSFKFLALTGSGCLYPFGALNQKAFDWDAIKKLSLTTDDLWIKVVSVLSGTKVVETNPRANIFTTIKNSQRSHLAQVNCLSGGNDDNFRCLLESYPEVYDIIKES